MPAVYTDDNGVEHYYFPPPPPPPPPPAQSPQFKQALNTAGAATKAYQKDPNKANTTALDNDWNTVQEMIAEQYRLAMNSSDPAKEVADLNQQYGQVFQGGKGAAAEIYNKCVLPGAQKEAKGETPGERNAEIDLYNGLNEPDSSSTKAYDVAKADIDVQLQILYGNGTDGAYTADQYKAAEAAASKDFGADFSPVITGVGDTLQQGEGYNALLQVLQTGSTGPNTYVLTPAQIAALSNLPTPPEKNSKTLTLTQDQAQLANIDPVTLSLLMTAGIKVPKMSPQMQEIAKNSPSTFFYLAANGIEISESKANSCPPAGVAVFNLSGGQQLNITINGKPLTTAQLPPGGGGNGRPSTGQTPSTVLGVYLGSAAATKGSGVVVPGSVAVANLLLGDPNLDLQVTPKTLSTPTTLALKTDAFLVSEADSARPGYINTKLTSLLAAAPPPNSKDAAAYFSKVINPFLTTQMGGFFSSDDAVNFWNSSLVIDSAGVGSDPKTSLHTYLQSWLGTQFNNPKDPKLLDAADNIGQILTGASPGLATMLIPMIEGRVNKLQLEENDPRIRVLFDDMSQAVQIADQFPVLSTAPNPPKDAAAAGMAKWLNSLGTQFGSTGESTLEQDTGIYGYTDLPNALANLWKGSADADAVQYGEKEYNSDLQQKLGTANYTAFENNRAQVLNGFFGQYANTPGIGKPISVANTAALEQAIISAYGFTPKELEPVTTHNGTQTVQTPSQARQIVDTDLAWIQNQSLPGATVTILPFMFASAGLANGTEGGVFFDVWNPAHQESRQQYAGRAGTRTEQVDVGPSHVLIDGSAAGDALQLDPNVWQHPEKSDVKWHFSSYRDFQLSNTDYQNGTIYTLPGNQLGIGPNGAASSATDFHKEFDAVMGDVVGVSQIAGLVLAPFTGGASLAITGTLGLVWGTYQGIEGYDDARSHGENFSLSNPNTRWEAVSDITVAAGWATMGVAGAEATLTRDAADAAGTLTTATDEAGTLTTAADGAGTVTTTAASEPATLTTVADGAGTVTTAADVAGTPATVAAGSSNTVKVLGVTKKVLEYGNYGLATVQTGQQVESFAANYDHMSFWQRVLAGAAVFEGTFPFAAEPMNRAWFDGDWNHSARQQQREDGGSTPQQPRTESAQLPPGSESEQPPVPAQGGSGGGGGGPPRLPPTGGGERDPLNPDEPDESSNTPVVQTTSGAKDPAGPAPVVATSIFSPDVSENDSVARIDAMTPAELRDHGAEADFVLSYYDDLFMTSDPPVPSDPRFADLAGVMRTAFNGDHLDELESLRSRAEFLNEMIAALPRVVTESDVTAAERNAVDLDQKATTAERYSARLNQLALQVMADQRSQAQKNPFVTYAYMEAAGKAHNEAVALRAQADTARAQADSLRDEFESQQSSGPTVAASSPAPVVLTASESEPPEAESEPGSEVSVVNTTGDPGSGNKPPRLQHATDVVKHFLHIPYDGPWIGGKTVRIARDVWARTVGARRPHGEYKTPQQMRDDNETPPTPIEGTVYVESPQTTLPISVDPKSKGTSLAARVGKIVPTRGRRPTLTVEKARRVSLATPLGQSTVYVTPTEFVAPEEAGRGVESYFSIQFQSAAGSVDDAVRNPETVRVIDAGLESARTSVDPNIRDAAANFIAVEAQAAADGAPEADFTEAEKGALRAWIATENDSRFIGSKPADMLSTNAQNVVDRLFDDTTLPGHLIQAARDMSATVFGSSEPVVFGDDVPQADVPLTLGQSRELGRLVLAAWELRGRPDNPLTAGNNNTLTDIIFSTKVSKDDWRTVQKFALGAATSPDGDLATAGESTLNALGTKARAGALTHAQLNALVPLFTADRNSVSVAGSLIEPSAKDTLSLRGTLVKDLVEGGTWSSPRVWEVARGYARYLKAFSPDPVVSKAAAVALKELPRFSVPKRGAPIADPALRALNRLFDADEASPYRQRDPAFDNNFTYRPDRNLIERYLAVTQQHPSNILLSELSEEGIPKAYPSPGITYQVSFDLVQSMNTRPEFGFAKPLDENNPAAGYGPYLVPSEDGTYYTMGAPAYVKVIAQRTIRIALPWSPLDLVGLKVRLEVEMHSTKYLYNYLDAGSGRVYPGYTTFPKGMRLTPHQAALLEIAFRYDLSPYTKEGRNFDMMAGLSQAIPVWKVPFRKEWWRGASLGKALPREMQSTTEPRRVLDRRDGVLVASLNLEIPHTAWVEHLTGAKVPRLGLLTFSAEGVRKFMRWHQSADRTPPQLEGDGAQEGEDV